jgi:hypothetical protein
MKSQPDFYGLPRDGQIAEERLCDAPSTVLRVAPVIESFEASFHRFACDEPPRVASSPA